MELINFNRMLKFEGSITHLPGKTHLQEDIVVPKYRFQPAIRNKIFNYKETA